MIGQSPMYRRIAARLGAGECVVLDGGVASEVARQDAPAPWTIYDETERVLDVHRRYAAAGCDVISTNTWGLLTSAGTDRGRRPGRTGLPAWTVATRDAVSLARRGIAEAGRAADCAVAFSLNDADPLLVGTQELLALLWSADPPDLALVETLTAEPSPALLRAITGITESGMPVWVSFKCSVTASALAQLHAAGVSAVLVNCLPAQGVAAAVADLVSITSLPVGCYPRLDAPCDPVAYGELAAEWRRAGARIIGGCCGVGPDHVAAVRERVAQPAAARS